MSLVAVFIPILLMGGMLGRLFREFAVTLSVAILISLIISLTTTPMMCATLLKPERGRSHGWFFRAGEHVFNWLHRHYETSLSRALKHPRLMIGVTLTTVVVSVLLFIIIPKGFFSTAGYGTAHGNDTGFAGYFVSGHER